MDQLRDFLQVISKQKLDKVYNKLYYVLGVLRCTFVKKLELELSL